MPVALGLSVKRLRCLDSRGEGRDISTRKPEEICGDQASENLLQIQKLTRSPHQRNRSGETARPRLVSRRPETVASVWESKMKPEQERGPPTNGRALWWRRERNHE